MRFSVHRDKYSEKFMILVYLFGLLLFAVGGKSTGSDGVSNVAAILYFG